MPGFVDVELFRDSGSHLISSSDFSLLRSRWISFFLRSYAFMIQIAINSTTGATIRKKNAVNFVVLVCFAAWQAPVRWVLLFPAPRSDSYGVALSAG